MTMVDELIAFWGLKEDFRVISVDSSMSSREDSNLHKIIQGQEPRPLTIRPVMAPHAISLCSLSQLRGTIPSGPSNIPHSFYSAPCASFSFFLEDNCFSEERRGREAKGHLL